MIRLLLCGLCLLGLAMPLHAQQRLAHARQSSYLTKVFRLSNEQARFLYEHDLHGARPEFFRQPVDSFPTDSLARYRRRPLPPGYYLVAHAEGPQLVYWLRSETDRLVTVLDNQVDLVLVVRDSLGRPLGAAAQVQLRRRRVPYDDATQAHRLARAGRPGLVAVTYRGRTTFHSLERTFPEPPDYADEEGWARLGMRLAQVPPKLLRGVRRVAFGFPLGYLVVPTRRLILDLVHFSQTTTGPVGLGRSVFSPDVRQERQQRRAGHRSNWARRQQWSSYVAFSKPRYRPSGDTLRLKMRLLHRPDGRPLRRRMVLWLGGTDGPSKKLAELRPVRPGSYEYALPLTDTLGLRPDNVVQVRLATLGGLTLASGQFRLEDYELDNTRYALRVGEKEHRRGARQAFFLRGTDANELNLLDARVQLSVTPAGPPSAFAGRTLFVPDTLWRHAGPLDAAGETRLELPAALPAADLRYQVQATFLNADNERHTESASVSYQLDPGQLSAELLGDSVRLRYLHLGQSRPHRAYLKATGGTDLETGPVFDGPVHLPLTLPLNPRAFAYSLTDSLGHAASVSLGEDNAGLALQSDRTHDSIFLALDNPRRLACWRFVYRGSHLVHRSYGGPDWRLALPATTAEPWYVSVHYLWGEEMLSREYVVALPQKQLRITAEQPELAYPGQRIELRYTVTDGGGRPVAGADLTSYAHTSKFEQATAPALPSFERRVLGRVSRRRFELDDFGFENSTGASRQRRLDWQRWRPQLGLDSLRFYHFLYPVSGQFYEYQPAPGGLTQVAPFVVDSGRVQAPIAVYIDGVPAYVHDINQNEPYSFVAEPGWHTISIRTAKSLVTLRDVYLRHLHKLTFSVDVNQPCQELKVEARPRFLPEEQLGLARSLLLLEQTSVGPNTLLRQGNRLQPVQALSFNRYQAVGGPFRPDSVLLRNGAGGLRRAFMFEPLFKYTLEPGLLKMRCVDPAAFGPLSGSGFPAHLPLDGFAYTEAMLRPQPGSLGGTMGRGNYNDHPAHYYYAPVLDNPGSTPAGQGRLQLLLPAPPNSQSPAQPWPEALYLLVTRPDQPTFQRLLAGLPTVHALPPGRYRVAVLRADSACWAPAELVTVQADGTTYLQLRSADWQPAGALSRRIGRLVRQRIPHGPAATPVREGRRVIQATQPGEVRPGWSTISGTITDHSTGEGIPGVTIIVKGTTVGVSTNADGTYALQVPPDATTLAVSSVGYVTVERPIHGWVVNVSLSADTKQLSEVVVVGYGSVTRREVTGAIATVLQGRVAGVQLNGATAGSVRIRGSAALAANSEPLLILNGLPFNGRIQDLDPATIANISTLKDASATAVYGSRGANGVILITTKNDLVTAPNDLNAADGGQDPRLALRRRFTDNGWWRPTLVTDARGQARTTVTLPDDVTGWHTFVLGSDDHGRTGSAAGLLRSFKALRAELAVPRFLLAGDRAQVIGKTLNYLPDTAQVSTSFRVGAAEVRRQPHRVTGAVVDTLTVTAPATPGDSLLVTFGLTRTNGYQDGEQRQVPILPVGIQERVGSFFTITAPDTTLTLPPFDPQKGPVTLRLETDPLPAILSEIQHVQAYAYLCNEQAASKLKALLLERRIREALGEKFGGDRQVNYLVRKLLAGRYKDTKLWGTWPTSEVSYWATAHVLEALLAAEEAGYKVPLDRAPLLAFLGKVLDEELAQAETAARRATGTGYYYGYRPDDLLRVLRLLRQLGSPTDFRTYLTRLARLERGRQPLDRYLAFTELRQQLQLPYQLDTLRRYRRRTQLGGVFFADTLHAGSYYRYLLDNAVGTTLLAYRILRAEGGHEAELLRLRVYLLGLRRTGHWRSTYEAAQVLETIGPDLFAPGRGTLAAQVTLGGGLQQELKAAQLPFEATLPATAAPLTLRKEGLTPVYATAYQSFWNPAPEAKTGDFVVTTTLAGQSGRRVTLKAGQPAELLVTVDVKAAARYVLVEVPIPAGCSYGPKAPGSAYEVHREYLRQQTGIFLDALPVGRHTFRISLQPRYRGQYTLNPAKAELVYFPTRFGRTDSKQAVVQ